MVRTANITAKCLYYQHSLFHIFNFIFYQSSFLNELYHSSSHLVFKKKSKNYHLSCTFLYEKIIILTIEAARNIIK